MDIFGKKEEKLKKRIDELEEQKKSLRKELEDRIDRIESLDKRWKKEKQRYKEAVSEKQEAERENNRLKDRLESLEDRLENIKEDQTFLMEKDSISASRAYIYFKNLEKIDTGEKNALTAIRSSENSFLDSGNSEIFLHEPLCIKSVFISPFPVEDSEFVSRKFALDGLTEKLDSRTLYIHLSAGGSGIGIFNNRNLVNSDIIRSDIKSRHKKGGYSQKRFERLREHQIESHFKEVWEHLTEFLDHAFEQIVVSATRKIDGLEQTLGQEYISVSSSQGNIKQEDDLERSFESGMGFKHVRLSKKKSEEILEKIDN